MKTILEFEGERLDLTPDVRPEQWTDEQRGRALEMIRLLANTPHTEWRSKKEIHAALSEFRHKN